MGEYQRLPDTIRKATELIRKGDMNVFRLVEDGVFDAQGNARYNADLDKVTHYGYDGERLEKIENRRLYLNYADIPENVRKVFLDWEDTRFYKHAGVDFPGMVRAFINNAIGGRRQGASTITMQLVKILFLTGYPRTIKYKLAQMYLALVMERHFTKEQILELYFNSMFFGNHTYGVGAAARLYFGKEAGALSLSECMYLLVVGQRPGQSDPYRAPEQVAYRWELTVKLSYTRKQIDHAQYIKALADVPVLAPRRKATGNKTYDEIYTVRFCENTREFDRGLATVYERLAASGLSDPVIAGIMGNMHVESGFDPECRNFQGRGLCQWDGKRVKALMSTYPQSYTQIESQIDFLLSEFEEGNRNADPGAMEFYNLARKDTGQSASYYADLFQALVERNLHLDHYAESVIMSNPAGSFRLYGRLSKKPNAFDGFYYLDAMRRRNYAEIYLDCIKTRRTLSNGK